MAILPTFSHVGWVTNPLERIDYLIAHFFETQKSQTHFYNDIHSFQSILGDGNTLDEVREKLIQYMTSYIATQFNNVELDVDIEPKSGNEDDVDMLVTVYCSFMDKGIKYSISNAIELLGNKVKRIYKINEEGE